MATTFKTQNIEWQARLQGVKLAPFSLRAAAFLVDAAIVALLLLLPSLLTGLMQSNQGQLKLELELEFGGLASVALAIGFLGLSTFVGKGRSIGKRLFGIRVVSIVHQHLSLWHCLERSLGYAASFLEAGFGFIQYFLHPNRQTVHDRIAETIVVLVRPER
jgi:uncharacterized RDD family membrane protein YckC